MDVTPANVLSTDIVFIVDEAQSSYFDSLTWLQVIKFQSNRRAGARICLFASYGSPTTGSPTTGNSTIPFRSTPVRLGPQQRVSLATSRVPHTPDVYLFYNEEEFNDALMRLCSRPSTPCNFFPDAGSYLYSVTNGHAGAVASMMNYIYDVCVPRNIIISNELTFFFCFCQDVLSSAGKGLHQPDDEETHPRFVGR